MKILPSHITLKRGPLAKPTDEKGTKLYYDKHNNLITSQIAYGPINSTAIKAKAPSLSLVEAHELTQTLDNWFVIAEDNLVIIDTDSTDAEELMRSAIADHHASNPSAPSTYRVESDTNFSHYYYSPTAYYLASPLAQSNRKQLKKIKIDILQGSGGGAWGPGANNHLKFAPSHSTLLDVQPIPDSIVDALLTEYNKETVTLQHSDYSPFVRHIGQQIDMAFSQVNRLQDMYAKIHNTPPIAELWEPFHEIAQYIIPNKYKADMEYPWHPDTIDIEASSNEFVQAMVSKLLRDNSLSASSIRSLATLITTQLWSRPITEEHCLSHMQNLETQAFGNPPIHYAFDSVLLETPTVVLGKGAARIIHRNAKGEFLVEGTEGLINFGSYSNFADSMRSKGNAILPDARLIKRGKQPSDDLLRNIYTIKPISTIVKPSGLQPEATGAITEFNLYVRETLHNIILGVESEPSATIEDFPTIMKLLKSITYDHAEHEGEQERLISYFMHLIAHKAKTFFYSPLVIQMNGKGGRGKGAIASLLKIIFGHVYKADFRKSDMSNADRSNALWGASAELPVTHIVEEQIKDESGDAQRRERKLYQDATYQNNIATLMVSTNMPKLFTDARRFILFSCFHSPEKFSAMDYAKAVSELRRFCAYLRDQSLVGMNKEFLTDSSYWNGKVQADTQAIVAETNEASAIADLYKIYMNNVDLTGQEIHQALQGILGEQYWYFMDAKNVLVRIICFAPDLVKEDKHCSHTITGVQAKEVGMETGRNTTTSTCLKQGYNKSHSFIKLKLNRKQFAEYEQLTIGVKAIEQQTEIKETL